MKYIAASVILLSGVLFLLIRSRHFTDYCLEMFAFERIFTRAIIGYFAYKLLKKDGSITDNVLLIVKWYAICYGIFMCYVFLPGKYSQQFNGISYVFNVIWLIIGLSLCVYLYLNRNRV